METKDEKKIRKERKYAAEYRKKYRARIAEDSRKRYHRISKDPSIRLKLKNQNRRVALRLRYGITPEEFSQIHEKQSGQCAVCREKTKLSIDHCHKTNKIRGLLCHKCNSALGLFMDSELILESAIKYLKQSNEGTN